MTEDITPVEVVVCVLSQNRSDVSKKFLEHFYQHTPSDRCHIIWIDNGSTDDTADLLSQYKEEKDNFTVVFSDKNLGVIGGRNKGFEIFLGEDGPSGSNICFLDNDQYVQEGWLKQHLAVLNRGYDLIGVEAWQMSPTFLPVHKCQRLNEWFTYVGCGGSLMRKEVPEKIGIYDERFNPSYFEDPDLVLRAHQSGFRIGWNFKARIIHVPHQTLGDAKDKNERFVRSLQRFRDKWKRYNAPRMTQRRLPEFDGS